MAENVYRRFTRENLLSTTILAEPQVEVASGSSAWNGRTYDDVLPVTVTLTASPSTINSGNSTTLYWTSQNATSLSIDNGVGTVTGNSIVVSPTSSITYTITATNLGGSATASTNVTVNAVAQVPSYFQFDVAPTGAFDSTGPYTLSVYDTNNQLYLGTITNVILEMTVNNSYGGDANFAVNSTKLLNVGSITGGSRISVTGEDLSVPGYTFEPDAFENNMLLYASSSDFPDVTRTSVGIAPWDANLGDPLTFSCNPSPTGALGSTGNYTLNVYTKTDYGQYFMVPYTGTITNVVVSMSVFSNTGNDVNFTATSSKTLNIGTINTGSITFSPGQSLTYSTPVTQANRYDTEVDINFISADFPKVESDPAYFWPWSIP